MIHHYTTSVEIAIRTVAVSVDSSRQPSLTIFECDNRLAELMGLGDVDVATGENNTYLMGNRSLNLVQYKPPSSQQFASVVSNGALECTRTKGEHPLRSCHGRTLRFACANGS